MADIDMRQDYAVAGNSDTNAIKRASYGEKEKTARETDGKGKAESYILVGTGLKR